MPKVLRILNRFNLGGPVYNAVNLTRYMSSDFETLLIGGFRENAEAGSEDIVRSLGIEPIIISEMGRPVRLIPDIIAFRRITKIIDDFKPDIVHSHASKAGAIGRMAAKRKNVKIIVHTFHGHVFHSYFNPVKTLFYRKIEQWLARQSSHIIAVSNMQKKELSKTYNIAPSGKITVIPLGFDLSPFRENLAEKRSDFRSRYNIGEHEIAIGIIGRLVPIKNHELFLRAVKHVKERSSKKIRAFIIGDGELKGRLKKLCRDLELDYNSPEKGYRDRPTVTFTSWIKDIYNVYPGLDIVAMTSYNEGTPVSLIEAQACGIPVVTTSVGGIMDTVAPNESALLAESNNVEDFSEKLLQLVEKEDMRERLSEKGWDHVKDKFHYTRLVSDMERLYWKLLDESG